MNCRFKKGQLLTWNAPDTGKIYKVYCIIEGSDVETMRSIDLWLCEMTDPERGWSWDPAIEEDYSPGYVSIGANKYLWIEGCNLSEAREPKTEHEKELMECSHAVDALLHTLKLART